MRNIVIVQRRLTHYRVPLFEALRSELQSRDICLTLLLGHGKPEEEEKQDSGEISWARQIPTRYFIGGRVCWQPIHRYLDGTDLVIVTQENGLLANHLLMMRPRSFQLAFWGHGGNLQSANPAGLKERFKRFTTTRVDWWFAYTQISAELVAAAGFPWSRLTLLNNAVATSELSRDLSSINEGEACALRRELNIGDAPVGIFVGSFYGDKRLEFLFEAAEVIRREVRGFHLVLVGDGPERRKVRQWCNQRSWAHWVGARFGREKAVHLSIAQIILNPGLVGLGILDAFVAGLPMLTTNCGIHSPEIAYLKNWENAVMTEYAVADYVSAAVRLLSDQEQWSVVHDGCLSSAAEYTLENMVCRFADGIERALASRKRGLM